MVVTRKFSFGDIVEVVGEGIDKHPTLKHLIGEQLVIDGVHFYQSCHFGPDAYMVSYSVFPVQYAGGEHDEEVLVGECNLKRVPSFRG